MLINWDDSLDVGYEIINVQHKKLIDLINQLHSAMLSGKSHEIMASILNELKNYTVRHFKTEEDMFEKSHYSEIGNHKTEHQLFVIKIEKFIEDFKNGAAVSIDLMNFLKDWLINHIKKTDMHYKGLLN